MSDPMNASLDELIAQNKDKKRDERRTRQRTDRDGDLEMGSTRGPNRRSYSNNNRNNRRKKNTPYSRGGSRYNTSGDSSKSWKHDLYDKDEDEVEETGWGTRKQRSDELLNGTAVSIDNLHWEISEVELKSVFEDNVCQVKSAKIFYDKTGRSLGRGEVVFDKLSDAQTALSLDGKQMKGQTISVQIKERKREPRRDQRRDNRNRRSPSPTRITFVNTKARR